MNKLKALSEGLKIFADHHQEDVAVEHDILYGPLESEVELSYEEEKILHQCGWFIDDQYNSWAIFI
jgi:hypothetical protein